MSIVLVNIEKIKVSPFHKRSSIEFLCWYILFITDRQYKEETYHYHIPKQKPLKSTSRQYFKLLIIGPLFYIDYEFGEDIYALSSYEFDTQLMFSFEI